MGRSEITRFFSGEEVEKFINKKRYGQNFLNDSNILEQIANTFPISNKDLVIEIGPGKGALTKYLIDKKCQVIAYEIDEETRPYLKNYESKKCKIIYGDFLKTNLKNDIALYKYEKIFVVANIPYYITNPIINKLITEEISISAMCLLVQKEVADRFLAQPGNKAYGSLTVYLNYYFEINKRMDVKNTFFKPIPKVDSTVVVFKLRENKPLANNEKLLFEVIKKAFTHKRKTIKNNLGEYNLAKINVILEKYGYSLTSRAEQLPLMVFIEISNILS